MPDTVIRMGELRSVIKPVDKVPHAVKNAGHNYVRLHEQRSVTGITSGR